MQFCNCSADSIFFAASVKQWKCLIPMFRPILHLQWPHAALSALSAVSNLMIRIKSLLLSMSLAVPSTTPHIRMMTGPSFPMLLSGGAFKTALLNGTIVGITLRFLVVRAYPNTGKKLKVRLESLERRTGPRSSRSVSPPATQYPQDQGEENSARNLNGSHSISEERSPSPPSFTNTGSYPAPEEYRPYKVSWHGLPALDIHGEHKYEYSHPQV